MKRRRPPIGLETFLAQSSGLRRLHDEWLGRGYAVTGFRTWRCRDTTFTVRLVWRKRDDMLCTVTCVWRGVVLP